MSWYFQTSYTVPDTKEVLCECLDKENKVEVKVQRIIIRWEQTPGSRCQGELFLNQATQTERPLGSWNQNAESLLGKLIWDQWKFSVPPSLLRDTFLPLAVFTSYSVLRERSQRMWTKTVSEKQLPPRTSTLWDILLTLNSTKQEFCSKIGSCFTSI